MISRVAIPLPPELHNFSLPALEFYPDVPIAVRIRADDGGSYESFLIDLVVREDS